MSTEKRKKPVKKKLDLAKASPAALRKHAEQLQSKIAELEKSVKGFRSTLPQLEFFGKMKGHWSTLPFLPEDLGFERIVASKRGKTSECFFRDSLSLTRMPDNSWLFVKDGNQFVFAIKNKFDAYQVLRLLGVDCEMKPILERLNDSK